MRAYAVIAILFVVFGECSVATGREWTSATGRHKVEAALVGVATNSVKLHKKDGKVISVKLSQLSEEDREYVQSSPMFRLKQLESTKRELSRTKRLLIQTKGKLRSAERQVAQQRDEIRRLSALLAERKDPVPARRQKPQAVLRPRQAIAAGAANSSLYLGVGGGHWVKTKADNGEIVVLEDGSTWQIGMLGRLSASLWLPLDPIRVVESTEGILPYRLINSSSNEIVEASYMGN